MQYQLGLYEKAMPASLSLAERLHYARVTGFDHLEISIDESDERQARLAWSEAERRGVRHAMEQEEMRISTMCLSGHRRWPLGSHDAERRARAATMFRDAVDLASDLGIRVVQLAGYDVYYEEGDNDTKRWFDEGLRVGIEYAATRGVLCGLETMEPPFMNTISKAMNHVRLIDSPYLGVYPDLGNLTNACIAYDLDIASEIIGATGHVVALHLKEVSSTIQRDLRYGEGHVDFAGGISAAWDAGVRLFVAEFWDDGRENWEDGLKVAHDTLRTTFDAVLATKRD